MYVEFTKLSAFDNATAIAFERRKQHIEKQSNVDRSARQGEVPCVNSRC